MGVLRDLEVYEKLRLRENEDDLLPGLSPAELQALADSQLAAAAQSQLNDLLDRNAQGNLSRAEETELDQLLAQIDSLNILKTRARYTLKRLETLIPT